ncbi:hypothetical protein H5410_000947 [Solanum commersonii]|uniref:DUF4371 domain-containing protein n=1 Tax=Solanum commersonii TaxID=4109 RepID=A0A9J6AXH7_SOLCO|nr:hypothetical protein H5410_000947 [Solanum commersonii]
MLDFKSLEANPKDLIPISSYGPNIRDANELESRGNAGDSFTRDGFSKVKNARSDYWMSLNASIDVARFFLTSEFSFCGHDESEGSKYKGAFLELLKSYGDRSFDVGRVILGNPSQNDIDDLYQSNSKDIVEQMALILRYVNKSGMVIELIISLEIHFDNIEDKLEELLKFGEVQYRGNDMSVIVRIILIDSVENLLSKIHEFEFVFTLHLMFKVSLFCGKHGISIPKMNEDCSNGKSKRKRSNISYLHHFHVEVFYAIIDLALHEVNNRFDVVTSDLLLGMASLSPVDSFANFHKDRIMNLAEYYPSEFGDKELRKLNFQLDDFIIYSQKCDRKLLNLKGIKDLARVMIETKLDQTWSLVKLTLIIHVATASVKRAFSSMKYIKNDLRNRMDEDLLNGCLVCYIECSIFKNITNDALIDRFQNMKTRHNCK